MLYDVIWNVHPPWDVFFHGGPQGIIPSCWYSYHQGKQWTPMFERCPWNGVQLRWRPRSLAPPPACTSAMPAASPAAAMRLCTLGAPRWMFDLGFRIISRWFQDDFKMISRWFNYIVRRKGNCRYVWILASRPSLQGSWRACKDHEAVETMFPARSPTENAVKRECISWSLQAINTPRCLVPWIRRCSWYNMV